MNAVIIQNEPGDEPRFRVVPQKDSKRTTKPTAVRSPKGFPVEGRPDSDLVRELRWYLEEFLGYPFAPNTDRADRVLDALKQWGRQAFDALFDDPQSSKFLDEAAPNGKYKDLHLQVSSNDPGILAWPWEAVRDRSANLLAQQCQIERRLDMKRDPQPIDERLPRDRVNVLLVTARPKQQDVRYRSISRPLIELVEKHGLAADVTVLRPPTFDELRRHLRKHPHHYHVLHFDGHGGYGEAKPGTGDSQMFRGSVGHLRFEDADGKPDEINANQLSNLLSESAVPVVVLNACRSATIDEDAEEPFASVAASFLRSGTRSVVAMAYSLYVSGAQQFLPAFYERLFDTGDVAQAVRAGRQQMYSKKGRLGRFPLHDWLVPVVYQQDPLVLPFVAEARKTSARRESALPKGARDEDNPYGFVGRDDALLELERAMLRPPAGILITGLGGVGKTTLARGFIKWLEDTKGLGKETLWFDFLKDDIRNAEFLIHRMGEVLYGGKFAERTMGAKLDALAVAMKDKRVVVVWDNFEVARGIPGTSVTANLIDDDEELLRALLKKLRGGASKVIITSRTGEEWLGHENCFELPIRGLDADERWDYCDAVLRDLGISPERDDPAMVELMKLLDGHPLAMRAILPRLTKKGKRASELVRALRSKLDLPEDELSTKLVATLRFVEDSLPAGQRPLMVPLSLFEGFVGANFLEWMAQRVDERLDRTVIDRLIEALGFAGLLHQRRGPVFEMHPTLTGYLRDSARASTDARTLDAWTRAFVEVMAHLADVLAPRELHRQRVPFQLHSANLHYALEEADRLKMHVDLCSLLRCLAGFAQKTHDFARASRLFVRLADVSSSAHDHVHEGEAYHHLGMIAAEQRDFGDAEQWYRKSLAIKEKLEDEGRAALTLHQLGIIAQEQRNFADAEQWYRKSLAVEEKLGNEHGAAITCSQLGRIAHERGDVATAEQRYREALLVFEKLGIEHHAVKTYHALGVVAADRRDFAAAQEWYRKSLVIKDKQHDEHGAAITYHELGRIAAEQRDCDAAERWYLNALAIWKKSGDERGKGTTCGQLGNLAGNRGHFEESGRWLIQAIQAFQHCSEEHDAQRNARNFSIFYRKAPPSVQRKLLAVWREAALGELPSTDIGDPQ